MLDRFYGLPYTISTGPGAGSGGSSSGSGATAALDNLASVNINSAFLFQTGTNIGSAAKAAKYLFLYGDGTFATTSIKITGIPTAARVLTLPDATDTLVGKATTDAFTNKTLTDSTNVVGGVTLTLGSDGTGDVYYRSAGGVLTRLAAGSDGNVLTLASGLPSWASAGGGGAISSSVTDAITNTVTILATFDHKSSGTPAASFGQRQLFTLQDSTTQNVNAAAIDVIWTTATHATHASDIVFYTTTAGGALTEAGRFKGAGTLQLPAGTASIPALTFNGVSTGFYLIQASDVGVSVGGSTIADFNANGANEVNLATATTLGWGSNANAGVVNSDAMFSRRGAANIRMGNADAASPIAQKLSTQGSRAATDSNVGGANLTISSGLGTGTGTISSLSLSSPIAVGSGTGAQTETVGLTIIAGIAKLTSYTVATLPAAATAGAGATAFVTDANATMTAGIGATVAGGGSNKVPVYSDGANWIIG